MKKIVFLIALSTASLYSTFWLNYKDSPEGFVVQSVSASSKEECRKVCKDGGGTSNQDYDGCGCQGAMKYTMPRDKEIKLPDGVIPLHFNYFINNAKDFKDKKLIPAQAEEGIKQECINTCKSVGKESTSVEGKPFNVRLDLLQFNEYEKNFAATNGECYCK